MHLCESAQAGRRNNHKTMDEMQSINLFSLPHQSFITIPHSTPSVKGLLPLRLAKVEVSIWACGIFFLQRHEINAYRKRNKNIPTIMLWIRCPIYSVMELNHSASQAPPVDCFIWCIKSWRCWMSFSTLADSSVMLKQHIPLKAEQCLWCQRRR